MVESQANTEEEKKKAQKERDAAKYDKKKEWARGRNNERKLANDHYAEMLIKECEWQYEHWKKTVTEEQKA